jgi:hypothetical protein
MAAAGGRVDLRPEVGLWEVGNAGMHWGRGYRETRCLLRLTRTQHFPVERLLMQLGAGARRGGVPQVPGTFNSLSRVGLGEVVHEGREPEAVSARAPDELFEAMVTERRVKIERWNCSRKGE